MLFKTQMLQIYETRGVSQKLRCCAELEWDYDLQLFLCSECWCIAEMTCHVELIQAFHQFSPFRNSTVKQSVNMNGISRNLENCGNQSRVANDCPKNYSESERSNSRLNAKSRNKNERNKDDEYQRAKREVCFWSPHLT